MNENLLKQTHSNVPGLVSITNDDMIRVGAAWAKPGPSLGWIVSLPFTSDQPPASPPEEREDKSRTSPRLG